VKNILQKVYISKLSQYIFIWSEGCGNGQFAQPLSVRA
jgi:hypothetical protein